MALIQVVAGTVLLPGAIGIASLRYRLHDADVVIGRNHPLWGLAVFVTATYVAVVGGLGTLLGQRAGLNPFLAILAIGVAAALLDPVRIWLRALANVPVYGRRASPYQVLSDFARSVGRPERADILMPTMARLLREGTGAATLSTDKQECSCVRPQCRTFVWIGFGVLAPQITTLLIPAAAFPSRLLRFSGNAATLGRSVP